MAWKTESLKAERKLIVQVDDYFKIWKHERLKKKKKKSFSFFIFQRVIDESFRNAWFWVDNFKFILILSINLLRVSKQGNERASERVHRIARTPKSS